MDDTQQSRVSDAGATRKRRSSILKVQRAPRAPFSELEFNVATPTDTGKNRRVSFSRRTGVAEFVTNEATTTWKNFYEEHNKSLESSGNESGAHGNREPIGHIGKRIFEQQFQEIEAVDFITSLDNLAGRHTDSTINVNFTQPDSKSKFELSAFTDHHSKLFGDDLAPTIGEMSGRIDVDFSAVQSVDVNDDLDEIQRDLQRHSNAVGPAPFRDARDFSEYIEVELNSTHAVIKNDESDMSITETITSPKVKVSKSHSSDKSILNWVDDKENNCLDLGVKGVVFDGKTEAAGPSRPQEPLKLETKSFSEVLADLSSKPVGAADVKGKTVIYDDDADMSITGVITRVNVQNKSKTIIFNDDLADLSMTRSIPANLQIDKENKPTDVENKSIFDRNNDMSFTAVLPSRANEAEKRRTIIFDDGLDISITKPIPTKLLSVHSEIIKKTNLNASNFRPQDPTIHKTKLYDDDLCEMSITKPISAKLLSVHSEIIETDAPKTEKRKTILFDSDGDLSMTKPIPTKLLAIHSDIIDKSTLNEVEPEDNVKGKRKTILFDDQFGDLSMTKPIPTQLLSIDSKMDIDNAQPVGNTAEKRKTILFDDNLGDLSMTKPIPAQFLSMNKVTSSNASIPDLSSKDNKPEKRKTILFDDDLGDLSMTKPIPAKILSVHSATTGDLNISQEPPKEDIVEKRKTIVFDDDLGDLSMTRPIPAKLLATRSETIGNLNISKELREGVVEKRKTIVFDDDLGDLSMTKPIPTNFLCVDNDFVDKTQIRHDSNKPDEEDIKPIPKEEMDVDFSAEMNISKKEMAEKHKSILSDVVLKVRNDTPDNCSLSDKFDKNNRKSCAIVVDNDERIDAAKEEKRKTVLYEDSIGDVSITEPIAGEHLSVHSDMIKSTQENLDENRSVTHSKIELENVSDTSIRKSVAHSDESKDVSISKNILGFSNFQAPNVVVYQVATKDTTDVQNTKDNTETYESQAIVDPSNMDISTAESGDIDTDAKEERDMKDLKDSQESCKLEDKSENTEVKDVSRNVSVDSVVRNVSAMHAVSKKSILFDLLDMSHASLASGIDDKDVTADIPSVQSVDKTAKCEKMDSESVASEMFYITKDTDSEDKLSVNKGRSFIKIVDDTETSNEVLGEPNLNSIQKVISEIKNSDKLELTPGKILETETADDSILGEEDMVTSRYCKSFKEVDNTKELLDMISDLTAGNSSSTEDIDKDTINTKKKDPSLAVTNKAPLAITLKNNVAYKDQHTNVPRRVSIASNRQSIILSREDLLNNISMAQAALQMSIDMDSETEDSDIVSTKKSLRISNEVVKTLEFKDESSSEVSLLPETRSPLRKATFGETSREREGFYKSNVIPSYLKDVSDGIKSLMQDLVKPLADQQPFEAVGLGKGVKKTPSTCSTHIQANLYTSSQIDVTNELQSNPESILDMAKETESMVDQIKHDMVARNLKEASFRPRRSSADKTFPGKVLLFDHVNPLNNVLLAPTEYTDVHRYCPPGEEDGFSGSDKSHSTQCSVQGKEYDVETVSVRYNVENYHMSCQSGDAERISNRQSFTSNTSKRTSIDQSIGAIVTEVRDIEVNTEIVMKKNKELLEASSSLTLVDDALATNSFDIDIDAPKVPLKVIYKLKDEVIENVESALVSNDEDAVKANKRVRSSRSDNANPNDVTPKPVSKLRRLSGSPNYTLKRTTANKSLLPERETSSGESKMEVDLSPSKDSPRKRSPKKKNSPRKVLTVQQLLTEFNVQMPPIDQEVLNKQILEALVKSDSSTAPESLSECEGSLELVSSFTSSRNWKAQPSETTTLPDAEMKSLDSNGDEWGSEQASERDSSVNVVAMIDVLPFMGSPECEWASSGADSWSFRLLHGRLRLAVRLGHRHHNAARTRVRGDTPVTALTVHRAHHASDKMNSVAMLCIKFAGEAMSLACTGGCARAGAVPRVLRRAAGLARRALKWGRAMHHARVQLAYTLTDDGRLLLKVANIPLRCVWEVAMTLRLCARADDMPWPRADAVSVTRVLDGRAEPAPRLGALLAAVPHGWGHVPATIWGVFKYLKNMTAEDEETCFTAKSHSQPVS